jgi:hypothetical protein
MMLLLLSSSLIFLEVDNKGCRLSDDKFMSNLVLDEYHNDICTSPALSFSFCLQSVLVMLSVVIDRVDWQPASCRCV